MKSLVDKYLKIAEDITIDGLNHTILRNGIGFKYHELNSSLAILEKKNKSIIRWGDGESFILLRRDIYWHEYSPELRKRMIEILENYSASSPYYLCLPGEFLSCDIASLKAKKRGPVDFYQMHKGSRYIFYRFFNKKCDYLTHFLFKGQTQDHFQRLIKQISGFKTLIVVKEDENLVDSFVQTNLGSMSYSFIKIPGKSAFREYERIHYDISKRIDGLDCNKDEILILIAAGPCAKVLAYDFSLKGITVYDVGKFFECWTDNADLRE